MRDGERNAHTLPTRLHVRRQRHSNALCGRDLVPHGFIGARSVRSRVCLRWNEQDRMPSRVFLPRWHLPYGRGFVSRRRLLSRGQRRSNAV